jgi:hypothetical protein
MRGSDGLKEPQTKDLCLRLHGQIQHGEVAKTAERLSAVLFNKTGDVASAAIQIRATGERPNGVRHSLCKVLEPEVFKNRFLSCC